MLEFETKYGGNAEKYEYSSVTILFIIKDYFNLLKFIGLILRFINLYIL